MEKIKQEADTTDNVEMKKKEDNGQNKNKYIKLQILLGILAFLVAVGGITGIVIGAIHGFSVMYLLIFSVIVALIEFSLGTLLVIITIKAYKPK